jgi:hypothetical protein
VIKAVVNNKYVCAENAGASYLMASRHHAASWERFTMSYYGPNLVAFKSHANGKYVCAENAGASALIANRDRVGPWELF